MWQFPVQLGSTGLQVIFLSNGQVALDKQGAIPTTFDTSPSGRSVVISSENVLVGDEKIEYNRAFTLTEEVREYLKLFNMVLPRFNQGGF